MKNVDCSYGEVRFLSGVQLELVAFCLVVVNFILKYNVRAQVYIVKGHKFRVCVGEFSQSGHRHNQHSGREATAPSTSFQVVTCPSRVATLLTGFSSFNSWRQECALLRVWLLLLTVMFVRVTHVIACSCGLYVLIACVVFRGVNMPSLIYPFSVDGLVSSFQHFVFTNSTAVNILINVFWCVHNFCWVEVESYR